MIFCLLGYQLQYLNKGWQIFRFLAIFKERKLHVYISTEVMFNYLQALKDLNALGWQKIVYV